MLGCSNSVLLYRVATIWYQDDGLHEGVQFLIKLVCQSMLLHGVQVLQMLGCSNSVLFYCTGWLQSSIRMILRVRFVRGFPVSNDISVSKSVSSTGCACRFC